jgi:hypothetical protein
MEKIDNYRYTVATGENCTVKINMLDGVGRFYEGSLDGENRLRPGNDQWTFSADRPERILGLWFEFPGAPAGSSYNLVITGSAGGSFELKVTPSTPLRDFALHFERS